MIAGRRARAIADSPQTTLRRAAVAIKVRGQSELKAMPVSACSAAIPKVTKLIAYLEIG
jgi:hypothetical protein